MKKVNLLKSTKQLWLIIVACVIISFNSCNVYCPAFPDKYIGWFPYYENQELCFKNRSDSICCRVSEYEVSEEYKTNCECGCDSYMSFRLLDTIDSILVLDVLIGGENSDSNGVPKIGVNFTSGDYFLYEGDYQYCQYYDSLAIHNLYYNDVLVVQNFNGNEPNKYIEIKVVKSYGLFEFSDIDGHTWVLETE